MVISSNVALSALRRYIVQCFALIAFIFGPVAFLLEQIDIRILNSSFAPSSSGYLAIAAPFLMLIAFRGFKEEQAPETQNRLNALVLGTVIILGGITDPLPGYSLASVYPFFVAAALLVLTGRLQQIAVFVLLAQFPIHALLHLTSNSQVELAVRGLAASLVVLITIELWLRHASNVAERRGKFFGIGILLIALCPLALVLYNYFGPEPNPRMAFDSALGFVALSVTGALALWRPVLGDAMRWGLAAFAVVGFVSSLVITGDYALPVANITIAICFLMLDRVDAVIAGLLSVATLTVMTALGAGIPTDHALRSLLFSILLIALLFSASKTLGVPQDLSNEARLTAINKLFFVRFLQFVLPTLSLLMLVMVPIEIHLHGLGESYTLTGKLQPILYIPLLLGLPFIVTSGWLFARGATRERELELQTAELERQITTTNLAMNIASFGLLEFDKQSRELRYLAGTQAVFSDGIWRPITLYYQLLGISDADIARLEAAYEKPGVPVDYTIFTPEGESQWLRLTASPKYTQDGRLLQRLIWTDITEEIVTKHQLEANFGKAQNLIHRLEQQQERERRMFAVIGHELRTPAAALKMLQEEQGVSELKPYGQKITETTDHLLSVLDNLRAVTKPESALKNIVTEGYPFQEIEKTVGSLEHLIQSSGVQVAINGDNSTDVKVRGNFQGLRQIVTNLVKNALIHSGATELRLELSRIQGQAPESLGFMLSVCDNGKGIAQEVRPRLFDAFYRGDTDVDGTGLGLHLSRDLAGQLGGELIFKEDFVEGSCFVLTWMMEQISVAESADVKAPLSLVGKRILFAEDNATIALLTTAILKKLGAEVVQGSSGRKALDQFEPDRFDLILTDIFMPEMNGYEFTEAIRARDPAIPIIGVTAATVGSEVDELMACGASAVISKPISAEKLKEALEGIHFDGV